MKPDEVFYNSALQVFVKRYKDDLESLFDFRSGDISDEGLCLAVDYVAGLHLRACFEYKGVLNHEALNELRFIPRNLMSPSRAAQAIAQFEVGQTLNKPLHKSFQKKLNYGSKLINLIEEWRTKKMRSTFKKLINSSLDAEKKAVSLVKAIQMFRKEPSAQNKAKVSVAVKNLNKSLVSSHYHARAGAAWSLRAGFTGIRTARAMNNVYIKKIARLGESLSKLDTWLNNNGIKSQMAEGIHRRKKILNRELMLANADPSINRKIADDAEKSSSRFVMEHGSVNYA